MFTSVPHHVNLICLYLWHIFVFQTLWIDIWQHSSTLCYVYLSLSTPHFFPSASGHRGLFPLTGPWQRFNYFICLVCRILNFSGAVFCWEQRFLLPPPDSIPSSLFLHLTPSSWHHMLSVLFPEFDVWISYTSPLSYNFVPHRLCHLILYLRFAPGQIAAVVCNSLQGSQMCPPPSQILHRSVSVTQREDLSNFTYGSKMRSTYSSHWLAHLLMSELFNMI